MELVDREQCCSCVTAARTEAGLFGDSFLQVRGNLKCATPVEWLDGAVEGGPSLLHRVVWSQVRTIRREMELCRRRRKRVEVAVSYTHLRAHETRHDLVCRLLLEKK